MRILGFAHGLPQTRFKVMVLKQVLCFQGKHIAPVKLKAFLEQTREQDYTAIRKGSKGGSHRD
jgi:hypothetical protein